MDQRARTAKTLACLVGAMTGTAALLGWMDPSLPPTADALSADRISRLARSAVVGGADLRFDQWGEIEVLGGDASASAAPLLAAKLGGTESHFLVPPDGRPVCTIRWRRQQPVRSAPHTVWIEVARCGAGQAMTPAQQFGVQSLIAALNEAITPAGPLLPVRTHEDL